MKHATKIRGRHVRLMQLEQVLAQWWCFVAFRKAMNLLHWVMRAIVLAWRTTMAIEMTRKVGTFNIIFLFAVALVAAGVIRSK